MANNRGDRAVVVAGRWERRAVTAKAALSILGMLFAGGTVFSAPQVSAQEFASLPDTIPSLYNFGGARPVPAWHGFCERHPVECSVDVTEAEEITLTPEIWATIVRINRSVNARIKPMTDKEQWGVVDSWDFPKTGFGDCEDYQLLKRRELFEAGLPRRAMRMTVVLDELNEGHAVLKIRTDRGDFVLDNKTNKVLPWDMTGYVYIKREGHDSVAWISLGGAVASPTAVATAER